MTSPPNDIRDTQSRLPRSTDAVAIGTVLHNRYQTISYLGRGGMSNVYKALDTRTGRSVAVKVLHSELLSDETRVKRFEQEAKTYRNLRHRHIVKIFDFFTDECERHCLVMEYMEGKNLSETLDEKGRLSVRRAIKIFSEICSALGYAHQQGVVHRDLKPSNIALVEKGGDSDYVKILDFGIAKLMPSDTDTITQLGLTQTGEIVGSPLYMSPEQCMAKPIDLRSDIYSLGCLMYEALTGQPPLVGGNVYETFHMQTHERPKPLATLRPEFKDGTQLESIILRCMAKNPKHRYQSMQQVSEALDRVGSYIPKGTVGKALDAWHERRIRARAERGRGIPPALVAGLTAIVILSCVFVFQDRIRRLIEPAEHRYIHAEKAYNTAIDAADYDTADKMSLTAFNIASEEKKDSLVPAMVNLIDLYRLMGRQKEADNFLERIAQVEQANNKDVFKNEDKLFAQLEKKVENDPAGIDEIEDYCFQLNDQAVTYIDKGLYKRARDVLSRTIKIARAALGEKNLVYATLVDNRALLSLKDNLSERYDQIGARLEEAIETRSSIAGKESAGLVPTLEALSEVKRRTGDLKGAEEDAQHALSIARSAYRSSSTQASVARLQLAQVYLAQGQTSKVLHLLPPTISVLDRPESEADKAMALVLYGNALRRSDKYTEAIAKFEEARELVRNIATRDPLIASQALLGLADVYNTRAKHDPARAEALYRRSLSLMLRSNSREESQVVYIMERLARLYRESGRSQETEKLYRMVEHVDKTTGKTIGLIEDKLLLGQYYRDQQKFKEAQDNIENALSLSQSFFGAQSARTCEVTAILADTYIWQKDYVRAHGLVSDAVLMLRSDNLSGKLSRQAKLQVLSTYQRYLEQTGKRDQAASIQKELGEL